MRSQTHETMLAMLDERALETLDAPESLLAGYGLLAATMSELGREMSKRDADQDADRVFELLLVLSTTALLAASEHVIPALSNDEEETE